MTIYDSSLELKLASIRFNLKTADAAFESKHPRDGGKFTTKGGGDSDGADDEDELDIGRGTDNDPSTHKKPDVDPRNVIDDDYTADIDQMGSNELEEYITDMAKNNSDGTLDENEAKGLYYAEERLREEFGDEDGRDSSGFRLDNSEPYEDGGFSDFMNSKERMGETPYGKKKNAEAGIKGGDIVAYKDPMADGEDERSARFSVIEDNGDRVVIKPINGPASKMKFVPTQTISKSQLINANKDSDELAKATDDKPSFKSKLSEDQYDKFLKDKRRINEHYDESARGISHDYNSNDMEESTFRERKDKVESQREDELNELEARTRAGVEKHPSQGGYYKTKRAQADAYNDLDEKTKAMVSKKALGGTEGYKANEPYEDHQSNYQKLLDQEVAFRVNNNKDSDKKITRFDPRDGSIEQQPGDKHPNANESGGYDVGPRTRRDLNNDLSIARSDLNAALKRRDKVKDRDSDSYRQHDKAVKRAQTQLNYHEEDKEIFSDPPAFTARQFDMEDARKYLDNLTNGQHHSIPGHAHKDDNKENTFLALQDLGMVTRTSGESSPGRYRAIKITKLGRQALKNWGKKKTASMTLMQGNFLTGSLSDQFKSSDGGSYVSYFLLNDKENLKGWGVTPESIPRHIASFKNMPFVITSKKFHEASPYGAVTDHPSTEHFGGLGIKLGSGVGPQWRSREPNDIMQQAKFQEEFRVGNIEDVFKKANGDWHALIRLDAKFQGHQMPPLVSPALFQLNPQEPSNHITTWVGMHLAGLDEKPAYGNSAVYTGSCYGTAGECLVKLSASMSDQPVMPCFKGKFAALNLRLAKIRLDLILASMTSNDHTNIQQENHLCSNGKGGMGSCATDKITHEI